MNDYKALTYLIGNQPATGAVTTLNSTEIDGWAYDPNLGSKPASVEISVDGVNYPAVSADDADTAAPHWPVMAITVSPFDMPTLDYGKHAIKVFVIDEPSGDPKQIGSGTVIINQRRRPAALESCRRQRAHRLSLADPTEHPHAIDQGENPGRWQGVENRDRRR